MRAWEIASAAADSVAAMATVAVAAGSPTAAVAPASAPTATHSERARARYTTGGVTFIHVDLLGTAPCNRSGLGVSGFHVHEVVASIQADGLSRRRYRDATVVKVPEKELDSFREFNRRMCEGDDLLPPFSPSMKYALLTKNHFVHAVKLFASGSSLLHATKEVIKPNPLDEQLRAHLSEGIACEVLREELWLAEPEAMAAMVGEDNMDAATNLAASEMEVLQTLRRLLDETQGDTDPGERFRRVLAKAQALFGNIAYTPADFVHLFNFASRVPAPLLDNLAQVHFAVVPAALLRVRPCDFGLVAKLDKSQPYVKVALVISMYVGAIASGGGSIRRQAGGVAAFATSIKKDAAETIAGRQDIRAMAEDFLKGVLRHYTVDRDTAHAKALLQCRARLFHRVGKLLQGWPSTVCAVKMALAGIEEKYAEELHACGAFSDKPRPLHVEPAMARTVGTPQAQAGPKKRPRPSSEPEILVDDAVAAPGTAADGSEGKPALVLAYDLPSEGMARLEPPAWETVVSVLWRRLAQQGLTHGHIKNKASADRVEVHVLEASDPIVYQARALKAFSPGQLVLVPFASAEPTALADAAKWKRPRTLHPHLPFMVALEAGAPDIGDKSRFMVKSPLASSSGVPASAPPPFWAVLQAQEEAHANMEVSTMKIVYSGVDIALAGAPKQAKKASKPPSLQVDVPVLTNAKALQRGEVLVFAGSPDRFGSLPKEEDDNEDTTEAASASSKMGCKSAQAGRKK